ncbi:MAG: Fe(3+)-hydroxamate ABC transporter permease FhuB [Neisseriaceae bacterium]|nr:Fe(3+)-hydroxamate ABC transporter permease FhuB [Neisseriaceae bacterium]MBP6861743.1 Fe(3+)-hydroxamate ABC transporter permease FhuB [Neisseriaceae bacterium]
MMKAKSAPWLLALGLLALCSLVLTLYFSHYGPSGWTVLWSSPESLGMADFLFSNNVLPRLAMAGLAGAGLGGAALLLQQLTHNPLAADSTLAVSSGAQLSLLLVSVFWPSGLMWSTQLWALLGAGLSLVLVLTLSAGQKFAPTKMILAGLVVNLYFGAMAAVVWLFFSEEARSVMLWGSGSLVQDSWQQVVDLGWRLALCAVGVALLLRPLGIMSLGAAQAQSLGVPVKWVRLLGFGLAAYVCASIVSMVGMLGFVGLAAAAMVQQLGIKRLALRLLLAAWVGACLLLLTDVCLQWAQQRWGWQVGTGAVTALVGAPLLLWLIFKALPATPPQLGRSASMTAPRQRQRLLWLLGVAVVASMALSLFVSQGAVGWQWTGWQETLLNLRYPRLLAAMATGLMLATAGVLLQRMSQNPMASPELLGISAGTAGGVLLALWLSLGGVMMQWALGLAGAGLVLLLVMGLNQRHAFAPEKVLLTGMAVAALFDACLRLFLASGDPRIQSVLAWLSGSTYQATPTLALSLVAIALGLFGACLPLARWLRLLDLGPVMAKSLGVRVPLVRVLLIVLSALLTVAATLLIGPLSFVGLLAPHMARALGWHKPLAQLVGAGLLGVLMMILADWLGRYLLFPYEVPAGLVATLLGGAYFLVLMRKI